MRIALRACALVLGVAFWPALVAAQEPDVDPPAAAPGPSVPLEQPPPNQRLPEIPETTVVGQAGAGSQGNVAPGSTIVTTPTRTGTALSEIGSSISVITAEQIQQRRITSVVEALRGLPGVDVVQQSGPGSVSSVFIRGATSEQTKVMIDGIWLNDPITPGRSFDFSQLSIDNIERIEVIRGPQSSLYGSDAIGGVINIITRKGSGPAKATFNTQGGAFGTSREALSVSGGNEKGYYSMAGSFFNSNGFSAADRRLPGNVENDGFRLGTISSRLGWTPAENFDVDFVVRYNRGTTQVDNGGGPFQDDINHINFGQQVVTRTQIRYATPSELWEQKFSYATFNFHRRDDNDVDPMHPFDSAYDNFTSASQLLDWQHNLRLAKWNTATVGAMYYQEAGSSAIAGTFDSGTAPPTAVPFFDVSPQQTLRDTAIYAQDQIKIADRWFTTLGTRQDHYSQAGTADTYRLTSLYRFQKTKTAIRGSLGTGFKAPSVFQLFDTFSGNPNLKPEQSKGWDYGVDQPFFDNKFVASATYFRNDFTNLINFNPTNNSYFNTGLALATGVELTGVVNVDDVTTITATYTRLDTQDRTTGLPLLRRPRERASLIVNRKFLDNRLNLNLTSWYVGNRIDEDFTTFPGTFVTLEHYILVNCAASYNLKPNWQVFCRWDNMFNAHYEEVFGFGTAPISFYAGTQFSW